MAKKKYIESQLSTGRAYQFDAAMREAARRAREAQGKLVTIQPTRSKAQN